jgi:hypothetical protein
MGGACSMHWRVHNAHKMSVMHPEGKMSVLRLKVVGERIILK